MGRTLSSVATALNVAPTRIVIFAKAPLPGMVKTRLIPLLGEKGAARLAKQLLEKTISEALDAGLGRPELCVSPAPSDSRWEGHLPSEVHLSDQGDGDLGQRLANAASRVLAQGERIILVGTDCPELDAGRIRAAATLLGSHDAVIYPARDGGYVLLGLARTDPSLFSDIAWSTGTVAATTIARIRALGWSLRVGDTLRDIDEPEDLQTMWSRS